MGGGSKTKTKKKTGIIHPSSRKAGQQIKRLAHDRRVLMQKKLREKKEGSQIQQIVWFQNHIEEAKRPLCWHKLHELIELYLKRSEDDIRALESKDDVADRKLSTNVLKADELKRRNDAEMLAYSTSGIDVPNVTTSKGFEAVRQWGSHVIDLAKIPFRKFNKRQLCESGASSNCFDCAAAVAVLSEMDEK